MRSRPSWGTGSWLPLIPAVIVFGMSLFGKASILHWAIAALSVGLGYTGERSRRLLADIAPYLAVALSYDLFRYVRALFLREDRVLGCGLRDVELALFPAGPNQTWGEFLAARHTPALDLAAAVPYTVFIYVVFGYGAYLFFRDRARMRRYVLSFAIANFVAFGFWLFLPAAPPWYVHAHGCAIDLSAAPNPGGLSRVDELLGISYFASFYGKAASVFGALPSLHCAYPLIGLLTAYRVTPWRFRVVHLAYTAVMPLAALYLDHHWLLDAVAGWGTAVFAVWLADRWLARSRAPKPVVDVEAVPVTTVPVTTVPVTTAASEGESARVG